MNSTIQRVTALISRSFTNAAPAPISSIQAMYDSLCKVKNVDQAVSSPWTEDNIRSCVRAMNMTTLDELNMDEALVKSVKENICMNIYSNSNFQIALFIIPAGWSLPLHDHPGMCVLSKLVTGRLVYSSFTPKACSISIPGDVKLFDRELTEKSSADDAWMLGATKGNYHQLVAEETCVMLDALLPPYDFPSRPCNYYEASEVSPGVWRLDVVDEPDNLPFSVPYHGYCPRMNSA